MLAEVIEAAGKWLERQDRAAERHDRREDRQEDRHEALEERRNRAIKAVLTALNTTKAYLADSDDGRRRRRSSEHTLVNLWTEAAVAVQREDPALARRFQLKAEYWADPMRWSERDIDLARIRIHDIARLAHGDLLIEPGD
jgi:hypothetical protein